jgi:ATP-dependent RNA helicase DDX56/DBP9
LLVQAKTEDGRQATRAVILVPTRELAEQITEQLKKLGKYCEEVIIANLAGGGTNHLNKCVLYRVRIIIRRRP